MAERLLRIEPAEWICWLIWALLMTVATAVAVDVSMAVVRDVLSTAMAPVVVSVVFGGVFGAVTGTAQWLFLRKRVQRSGWWLLASVVGWSIAWPGSWPWAAFGAITGTAQWLFLRKAVYRSGWWVLASAVGWSIALPVEEIRARFVDWIGIGFWFVDWPGAGAGAAYGAITGLVLILLLRRSRQTI